MSAMKNKFIYVFTEKERDTLLNAGFVMLKDDPANSMFVFVYDNRLCFALDDVSYIETGTLTF